MSGPVPGSAPDPGSSDTVVVTESRAQISALYGILTLAFAVALDRGVAGASGTSGRVAVVVIVRAWVAMLLRPGRLQVAADEIRYLRHSGKVSALSRQWGDELSFVKVRRGRIWTRGLAVTGTDTVLLLGYFSRAAIRDASRSRGWHFANLRSLTPGSAWPTGPGRSACLPWC
jgi:hypothetical protein